MLVERGRGRFLHAGYRIGAPALVRLLMQVLNLKMGVGGADRQHGLLGWHHHLDVRQPSMIQASAMVNPQCRERGDVMGS